MLHNYLARSLATSALTLAIAAAFGGSAAAGVPLPSGCVAPGLALVVDLDDIKTGSGTGTVSGDSTTVSYTWTVGNDDTFTVTGTVTAGDLELIGVSLDIKDGDGGEFVRLAVVNPPAANATITLTDAGLPLSTSSYDFFVILLAECNGSQAPTTTAPPATTPPTTLPPAATIAPTSPPDVEPQLPRTGDGSGPAAVFAAAALALGALLLIGTRRPRQSPTA
jgi:LPXTG-motif cell wall-anchored protein